MIFRGVLSVKISNLSLERFKPPLTPKLILWEYVKRGKLNSKHTKMDLRFMVNRYSWGCVYLDLRSLFDKFRPVFLKN